MQSNICKQTGMAIPGFSVLTACVIAIVISLVIPVSNVHSTSKDISGPVSDQAKKEQKQAEAEMSEEALAMVKKMFGVVPLNVRLTATDYLLDFRYHVVDPVKAASIINRATKPYLIVEKTGVALRVPSSYKLGPLRQSAQFAKPDSNYFMLFVNPGRQVKKGDKVTIVAGDLRIEHLTVQ